jgi:hypothetical protein
MLANDDRMIGLTDLRQLFFLRPGRAHKAQKKGGGRGGENRERRRAAGNAGGSEIVPPQKAPHGCRSSCQKFSTIR